jgi:serine/threonine-protein phosphatase 2A regulatory subunit A
VTEDEVYPIALLTEELKSDEVETRIKAMRRLRTVAQALGADRTRAELLPFLRGASTGLSSPVPAVVVVLTDG